MLKVISSHVFLRNRLHPGHLEAFQRAGAQGVEIFAARQHFDYTDRSNVRQLGDWFRSNPLNAFSMHMPLFADDEMGRGGGPAVNVVHPEKARRIDSMDEIKRALETAEQLPIKYLVLHLGEREDEWGPRTLEDAMTALEHLKAFATPLGVQLLLENITNDVTRPAHLLEILRVGHFSNIGLCMDLGHAHLLDGVDTVLGQMAPHLCTAHIHDNKGDRDAHLWPGEGTIAWDEAYAGLKSAPKSPAGVLEIHYALEETNEQVIEKAKRAFEKFD
jgi:sugar phosphate isomerase/epimerase